MKRSSPKESHFVKLDQAKQQQLLDALGIDFHMAVKQGIQDFLAEGARLLLNLCMQAEVNELCGMPYERKGSGKNVRWGQEQGTAIVAGTKEAVVKPRVRTKGGSQSKEVQLETYRAFNHDEVLNNTVLARLLAGVSTRKYATTIEDRLRKHGVSKASVSRRAIEATKPQVDAFLSRRLEDISVVAIFIDGIRIGQCQVIVCIGVGITGKKYVIGIQPGATENEIVCRDLLRSLKQRGLAEDRSYLFVVDGSAALASAIRAAFGNQTQIQRCHEHKIRDVEAYLPFKLRATYRAKLRAAWGQKDAGVALERLTKIQSELKGVSEKAASTLTEGMWDTLTLHRLGVVGELRESLRTTNVIESAFSAVRRLTARCTRFRNEGQIVNWLARGLQEVEKHFRPVRGNRQLPALRQALNAAAQAVQKQEVQ